MLLSFTSYQAQGAQANDSCLQDLWFCDTCTASGRDQLVRTAKAAQLAAKSTLKPVVSRADKAKTGPRVKRKSFSAAEPSSGVSAASQRAALAASDTSRHVLLLARSAAVVWLGGQAVCACWAAEKLPGTSFCMLQVVCLQIVP